MRALRHPCSCDLHNDIMCVIRFGQSTLWNYTNYSMGITVELWALTLGMESQNVWAQNLSIILSNLDNEESETW